MCSSDLVTQFIYVDRVSKRGRRLSVAMMSVAVLLLSLLFVWFGARRMHILLADTADRQFAAQP